MDKSYVRINRISRFLAYRDIPNLSKKSLIDKFGIEKVDVIIAFGNDLPYVAEAASKLYKEGLGSYILMCGGVGHSTQILKEKMSKSSRYQKCKLKDYEADIYAEIANKLYGIPREKILIDNKSTNCSENGEYGFQVIDKNCITAKTFLLLQDPLLQRRSYISAKKWLPKNSLLISFAPFIPKINEGMSFKDTIEGLWSRERFCELLMGEIWRLRDDEKGYGPRGMNFIEHVDIPELIESDYKILLTDLKDYVKRCI